MRITWGKWSNCKYINNRTNEVALLPWCDMFRRLQGLNDYTWNIDSITLQRWNPYLEKKEYNKACIQFNWELSNSDRQHNAYIATYDLDNNISIELMIYKKNADITEYYPGWNISPNSDMEFDVNLFTLRGNMIEDFSDEVREGKIQLSYVMEDGTILESFPVEYRFWWDEQWKHYDNTSHIPALIQHGTITNNTDETFKIKPLKCILTYQ